MGVTDLNMIRTFLAVYEARSVTAAAATLHVTQPTVSYTVGRLRRHFDDDLFRRRGHEFLPSPLADRIYPSLKQALTQIDATLEGPPTFDAASHEAEMCLAVSSLGELTFLPPIAAVALAEAPRLRLRAVSMMAAEAEEALVRGAVDLAISVTVYGPQRVWRTPFRDVEYVAVTSAAHALPETGPDMFAGRRLVQVSSQGGHTFPNQAIVEHGLQPQVALVVEGYASVPLLLEGSDLVAFLPRHVVEALAPRHTLALHRLPWPVQSPPVSVYTRPESLVTPAQRWFRDLVLRVVG